MEALLKNLKEHVTCSICLDTYTEPKTIDCLHTFCCECLEKHALTSQRQGLYRCPECQAQVGIPEENRFDRLPTSFLHNSLLSLLAVRRSHDGTEIGCSFCQKKSPEINYCFDCEKFLCPDCIKAHDLFRTAAFEGHKVTPVRQFQPEDYEALLKRQSFCSQQYHEREITRLFCLQCQICVCHLCIVTDHKSHDVVPIEKAADDEKANIIAQAELLKEKIQVCSDVIRQFETIEADLETNITIAKRQISETAEQMVAKIREREREAIALLEETRVLRIEKLHSAKELVRSLKKQRKQAAEFANNLVQRFSSSDILQSKKNLKQRFKELSEAKVEPISITSFVRFVSTTAPESLTLGSVKTTEPYFLPLTVEGLRQDIYAGLQSEIIVCPDVPEGELVMSDIEVVVEPPENASPPVLEKKDENVLVKFIPEVPGTYQITAKYNGNELANGPFVVQAKERQLDVVSEWLLEGETPLRPRGIAVNNEGLTVVTDSESHSILIFDRERKFVRKLGCHGSVRKIKPVSVTFLNDSDILVADESNHRIHQINVHTGNFVKTFGKRGRAKGEFANPTCVCRDNEGRVVVSEFNNGRIQVLTNDFEPLFTFGDSGPEKLDHPVGCVCYRNMFIVCDCRNSCLKVYNNTGKFLYKIGEKGNENAQFRKPWDLCVDMNGNLLVCDKDGGQIKQFTVFGTFTGKTFKKVNMNPWGITATPDGRILMSDKYTKKLYVIK